MKRFIPWYARIAAKLLLSRVPARYDAWRSLKLFSHGAMHRLPYALAVFERHWTHRARDAGPNPVLLEIGPGDSLMSAVIGASYGATHTYLVDAGAFATRDMGVYREAATSLHTRGLTPPQLDEISDLQGLLRACHATYGTQGLVSMREIPTASVDFIWSQAVLEHIRRGEFAEYCREMRRVLKPNGSCSHVVDLKDHLGGSLNNLRIPSRWWEQHWMAKSGFYTNRLRQSEMIGAFQSAGFFVDVVSTNTWERMPTPRRAMAPEFQHLSVDDLRVNEFAVVLKPS